MIELREAIGSVSSTGSASLRACSVPRRQAVEKLVSPLIEMQEDPEDPADCFCHLSHLTVKEFLHGTLDSLCSDRSIESVYLISEATIGNACLRYLGQQKYAQILVKSNGDWVTDSGEKAKDHHFLTY